MKRAFSSPAFVVSRVRQVIVYIITSLSIVAIGPKQVVFVMLWTCCTPVAVRVGRQTGLRPQHQQYKCMVVSSQFRRPTRTGFDKAYIITGGRDNERWSGGKGKRRGYSGGWVRLEQCLGLHIEHERARSGLEGTRK